MTDQMSDRMKRVVDQQEIQDVIYRYCRGIDRCDYDLVRSCYHPDAVDDHGDFNGNVEDFISYVQAGLPRFERTMHFIGNVLVEPNGDHARVESYIVAYHRLKPSTTKPERDYTVGLRYVDDFERRAGEWRIASRLCVFEWSRIDAVAPGGWSPANQATLGLRNQDDAVYRPSVAKA